ncbi:uncharacterized protein LOC126839639 [Adelges cooleyi]|uniref:uncharacterized protein LOC126839639 n=1 Tax=Adelges cooleyi TaxID=133065 RepID=UPI00217FBDF1|nr:uncharacterized protein LOC126839639 [Adelges cooleyi]
MASPNNSEKLFCSGKSGQPCGLELKARNVTDKIDAYPNDMAELSDLKKKLAILKKQVDSLGYGGGSAEQLKQKWNEISSKSELLKRAKQNNRQTADRPTQSVFNGNQGDHCACDSTNNETSENKTAETSFII